MNNESIFEKAARITGFSNMTISEQGQYLKSLNEYHGIKLVSECSRKEGIEEGKKEKALEVAKSLKEKGLSIALIAETTGLPEQEINKL